MGVVVVGGAEVEVVGVVGGAAAGDGAVAKRKMTSDSTRN